MSLKEEVLSTASEAWNGQESAKTLAERLWTPIHAENMTFRTFYDYCKVAVASVRDTVTASPEVGEASPRDVAITVAAEVWDGVESAKELSIRLYDEYGHTVSPRTFYDWCKVAVSLIREDAPIHSEADDEEVPPVFEQEGIVQRYEGARYKEHGDDYIYYPKTQSPFKVAKTVIEAMKRAYSNKPLGLGWTINQICRHWKIGRREFVFIKSEMGWTHDQDEFTREEHLNKTTEQLLEDREQRSRWFLEQEYKHNQELETARLASIGRSFEERTEVAMAAWENFKKEQEEEEDPPRQRPEPRSDRGEWTAVQVITDWHLGKPSNVNMPALEPTVELMNEAAETCDRLLLVFNGDYFHVDNPTNRTTALTPQDTANPDPFYMLARGYRLGFQIVEAALARFPQVIIRVLSGNHDEMAGKHFLIHLHTIYPEVVRLDPKPMQAEVIGDHLMLFEHGDGGRGKPERMLLYSFDEYRPLWGQTVNTFIWTGHLHHEIVKTVGCTKHFQLPSPSGSDRWHIKNKYGSMRELQVQIFDGRQHRATLNRKVEVVEENPYT